MPSLKQILFGRKESVKKLPLQTPEQEELIKLIQEGITTGEGPFGEMFKFNADSFNEGVSKPAIKNFQDTILPLIQEKYVAGNQVGGSGAQREKMKAGVDLQSKLAQLMYQAQQGSNQNRMSGIQTALGTKGFENLYKPREVGGVEAALQGMLPKLGKAAGQGIAQMGSGIGTGISQMIAG